MYRLDLIICGPQSMNGQDPRITAWMLHTCASGNTKMNMLTLTVLVMTIDAQWEGMGDVGSARYEPALLPPCPTIRVLIYSN